MNTVRFKKKIWIYCAVFCLLTKPNSAGVASEHDSIVGISKELSDSIQKDLPVVYEFTDSTKKVTHIERQFYKNYRANVFTALGMMVFVILILVSVDSWNPD